MSDEKSWITVGALEHAFAEDSYAPQPTSDLVGRSLTLQTEEGHVLPYSFSSESSLTRGPALAQESAGGPSLPYFAARLRDGIYFVDHLHEEQQATSVTLLLDLARGIATVLTAVLPEESEARQPLLDRIDQGKELTAVSTRFVSAAIDRPFDPEVSRHQPTPALIGRRVEYTYSPHERYEHIYLNERFYTWHCLQGSEKGLADTDRCHYYELGEDLYLFVWREKIVPTLGVVAVDFARMRTTGKIFGFAGEEPGQVVNFPVGARARLLNVTEREGGE